MAAAHRMLASMDARSGPGTPTYRANARNEGEQGEGATGVAGGGGVKVSSEASRRVDSHARVEVEMYRKHVRPLREARMAKARHMLSASTAFSRT